MCGGKCLRSSTQTSYNVDLMLPNVDLMLPNVDLMSVQLNADVSGTNLVTLVMDDSSAEFFVRFMRESH